jgi:MFS family permease
VTLNHPFRASRGSVGTPIAGVEVKIADDGEILVGRAAEIVGTQPLDREVFHGARYADLVRLQPLGILLLSPLIVILSAAILLGLLGIFVAWLLVVAALVTAIVVSAWMPIGMASLLEPHPGVSADWLILGIGCATAPGPSFPIALSGTTVTVNDWLAR